MIKGVLNVLVILFKSAYRSCKAGVPSRAQCFLANDGEIAVKVHQSDECRNPYEHLHATVFGIV
jgi:hypothetical protein